MGAGGGPRELYVLRSDRMKVVPGTDGWPVAYEYSAGGRSMSSTCGRTGCRCCTSRASTRRTTTTGCRR